MRPKREHATNNGQTYMVTFETWRRRALFRNTKWADSLLNVLYHYRQTSYLLHEFVTMPDHVHVLITPKVSLEKAVQYVKGSFSFRVKKELGSSLEVWQKGFSDHRIREADDYSNHVIYIRDNPLKPQLSERLEGYLFCSAHVRENLDRCPTCLKQLEVA